VLFFRRSKTASAEPAPNVSAFLTGLAAFAKRVERGAHAFVDDAGVCRGFVQFIICSDRKISIHRIWTLRPGEGNGSKMLQTLCELADLHEVELTLKALPIGRKPYPRSRDQLCDWYKRYGFEGTHKKLLRKPRPMTMLKAAIPREISSDAAS
jgi:hypothetical protein